MAELTLEGLAKQLADQETKHALDIKELNDKHALTLKGQEDIKAALGTLEDLHTDAVATLSKRLDQANDAIASAPASAAPATSTLKKFEGEAAVNLDKSGDASKEYHFSVDGNNYRFIANNVVLPPGSAAGKGRITAKTAQGDKALQAQLVKMKSGMIKQVF